MNQPGYVINITQEQYDKLCEIARKWHELDEQLAKFYEEDSEADICDVGEAAAEAFGYL